MEKTIKKVHFPAPLPIQLKRVAAYARVSSGKDAMLHSLSAQVSYYSDLIQKHPGWLYCGVYSDEALTGTKEDRNGFQRLLDACRRHEVDMVITKSISRFARNTVTLLEAIRELKGLGVDVFFEEQNIHTLSAEGELMLTILASYAQEESLSASENQKWRIRKSFEKGELMGLRRMFGYDISKGRITVNEAQAAIVREIFRRAVDGDSLESIGRWVREQGAAGALGGTITATRVRDILENEKYTGNALLQKTYINNHLEKRKKRNSGELPKYFAEGTHPAIIDVETFEKAQERMRTIHISTAGQAKSKLTVFTGLIRCGKCSGPYIRAYNHKAVWQCKTYRRQGRDVCNGKQIPEDILKQICCEVLGTEEFDEAGVKPRVRAIQADNDSESNILTFILSDGETIVKRWQNPPRGKSWASVIMAKASDAAKENGGRKDA